MPRTFGVVSAIKAEPPQAPTNVEVERELDRSGGLGFTRELGHVTHVSTARMASVHSVARRSLRISLTCRSASPLSCWRARSLPPRLASAIALTRAPAAIAALAASATTRRAVWSMADGSSPVCACSRQCAAAGDCLQLARERRHRRFEQSSCSFV